GTTRIWAVDTGELVHRFDGDAEAGPSVALTRNGRVCATACWDGSFRIREVKTGKKLRRILAPREWSGKIAFTPDGQRLLTGGEGRNTRLLDVENGNEFCRFGDSKGPT